MTQVLCYLISKDTDSEWIWSEEKKREPLAPPGDVNQLSDMPKTLVHVPEGTQFAWKNGSTFRR